MAKRQKNGTGSFRKRKDGTVEYRVYLGVGVDGKPLRPSFYGTSEKEALEAYREWSKNSGNTPIERVKTAGEWADKWLELYKKNGPKKIGYKTYKNYEMYVRLHIKPFFGKLKLEQVRPAHIAQFFGSLPKGMSWSSRHHILIALRGLFETAIENRFCTHNPVANFEIEKKPKRRPKAFPVTDISKILPFASCDRDGILICGLLHTGLREGELSALMLSDLHLDESYISVTKTVAEVAPDEDIIIKVGGKEKHKKQYAIKDIPKSDRDRFVLLTPQGVTFFRSLPKTGLFVFPSLSGSYMTPNQFRHRYDYFFKRLNKHLNDERVKYLKSHPDAGDDELDCFAPVKKLSPHKCRHTYATRLLESSGNLRVVQEQLGHQQVSTTEIYADVEIESRKANVSKLEY